MASSPITSARAHAAHDLHLLSSPAVWLCAVAAAFTMSTVHAADTADDLQVPSNAASMTPKQAYDHDKSYCNSGQATQPKAVCLKEAARAYQEARAGTLEPSTATSTSGTSDSGDQAAKPHKRAKHHKAKMSHKATDGGSATSGADQGAATSSTDNKAGATK